MAKGAIAKQEIANKILQAFPGTSFLYNDGKEVRINTTENGENIQIKVTFTLSKIPVENGAAGTASVENDNAVSFADNGAEPAEPTEEEKERLKTLLEKLGI